MKTLFKSVFFLLQKEFKLEWRQKYALNGILLYVVCTVVLVYLAFIQIDDIAWLTVFWIILLFAAVNAVAKSFIQEDKARQWYYYTLCSPQAVILSKIIYNVVLLIVMGGLALASYIFLLGNPVADFDLFCLIVLLGTISFALCFTLISAIAAQTGNSGALMPILSLPVMIPMISLIITASKSALTGMEDINLWKDLSILLAIDGMMLVLSYILFPYLWRD